MGLKMVRVTYIPKGGYSYVEQKGFIPFIGDRVSLCR